MENKQTIAIRLFGPPAIRRSGGSIIPIRSRKAQVILPLLATAPDGSRTRAWLQEKLWSRVEKEQAQNSLRQGLLKLQQALGEEWKEILDIGPISVSLKEGTWQICGSPTDGEFLEGVDLREEGFDDWLRSERNKDAEYNPPSQFAAINSKGISPLVAVLPFRLITGSDSNSSVLGDMFAEEMSRNLSRSNLFDTISHLSCRTIGRADLIDISTVRKKLDPDYVSTGSIRILGDHYSLDIDITEVAANKIIASNRFEGSVKGFIQGETFVLMEAIKFLSRSVVDAAISACISRPLPAVQSHSVLMAAIGYMHRNEIRYFARARELLEELQQRHPDEVLLNTWLANWYVLSATQGWASSREDAAQLASELTDRALNVVPDCSFTLAMDGFVQTYLLRNFSKGFDRLDEALTTDRSNALANLLKGVSYAFSGDGGRAVELTERASSLSPIDPQKYFYETLTATAHLTAGNFDRALTLADSALSRNPRHFSAHRTKIIALHGSNKHAEANLAAAELKRRDPDFTVSSYLRSHPAAGYETGRLWATALKESGIPQN